MVHGSRGDLCLTAFNAWSPVTSESRPQRGRVEVSRLLQSVMRCLPAWLLVAAGHRLLRAAVGQNRSPQQLPPMQMHRCSSGHCRCWLGTAGQATEYASLEALNRRREQRWSLRLFLVALWTAHLWAFGPIGQWVVHVYCMYICFSHRNLGYSMAYRGIPLAPPMTP
jgi:hypothetical protein